MKQGRACILVVGLLVALGCYLWPWYRHSTAGFTMNAFDLAEWASVHPAVRSSSPAMLTTLLLRLPLAAIGAGLVLASGGVGDGGVRWIVRAVAVLVLMRLLPPVEFFTSAQEDPNYRQMVLLVILAGIVMIAALMVRLSQMAREWGVAAFLVAGCVTGWWGLSRVGSLLDSFVIDVQIGAGPIGYSVCAGVVLMVTLWGIIKQKRRLVSHAA